jgi:threonine dehydratase
VLPLGTPNAKLQHLSRLGSTLIIHGANLDAAKEECLRLQQLHGLTYVSACDDPYVIAGHGTIGPEILKQANIHRVKAIFCPVGCGTLIAGIGIYVKRVAPHVKIIGVESNDANEFSRLLRYKRQRTPEEYIVSRNISEEMVQICAEVIDDIVQVDMDEVFMAIKDVYEDTRHILEPAGAMSIAGLKCWIASNGLSGLETDIIAITSETNVEFFEIPDIVKRAAIAERGRALRPFLILNGDCGQKVSPNYPEPPAHSSS